MVAVTYFGPLLKACAEHHNNFHKPVKALIASCCVEVIFQSLCEQLLATRFASIQYSPAFVECPPRKNFNVLGLIVSDART